jgi:hypothetical protein
MTPIDPNCTRQRAIAAGIATRTVYDRTRRGMTVDEAINATPGRRLERYTYSGKSLTLPEWAAELGIALTTLHARLVRGWSVQRTLTTLVRPRQRSTGGGRQLPGEAKGPVGVARARSARNSKNA